MKTLKEFINESTNNKLEGIKTNLDKNLPDDIKCDINNNNIIVLSYAIDKSGKPEDLNQKFIDLLEKSNVDLEKNNLSTFKFINNSDKPVIWISDNETLDRYKKQLKEGKDYKKEF